MTLTTEDVERVAQRVAELMRDELAASLGGQARSVATPNLVDAQTVASTLNVSRGFVYEHAVQLGGRRIAGGPKAPWRFELSAAVNAHAKPPPLELRPPRSARPATRASVPLMAIRGDGVDGW
jgi:hypothetical protein